MSVNKVQLANGETIIDISDSTVTPETLAEGVTAHDASGQKITGQMVPGGGASVQSDWNQNDSSAADFIKNKPFGEFQTVLYEGTNLSPENMDGLYCLTLPTFEIVENQSHYVIIDGEEYAVTSILFMGMVNLIGNPTVVGGEDNGLPFLCIPDWDTGEGMMFTSFIPFTSVYISTDAIKKIEQKYLPASSIVLERNPTDADNARYLYKTIDGEAIERVTVIELREFANSGRPIYFNLNGMWNIPVTVSVYEPLAYGYVVIFMENGERRKYYTAEYTA